MRSPVRRSKATPLALFLALLGTTCALGCHARSSELPEDREQHAEAQDAPGQHFRVADFAKFGVTLDTAGAGEVDEGVELPGEVRPNAERIAHIAPRFAGVVRDVHKVVGDHVHAGETLAVVESENLSPFEVKTAIDGTVIDKHIAPGETVTREQPAFIIADLSTVWVNITLYQTALDQVHVGQSVVIAATHGNLEATGSVAYITPVVDQATRTATARVVLQNPDGAWRPGLFVTATILSPVAAPVVVPRQALQSVDGQSALFVAVGDRFEARTVRVGRVGRTKVEILDGISAGDRFAVEQSFLIKAELEKGEARHEE